MNYLAVDTSGGFLTVIAAKNGQAYHTFVPDCAMKHSVLIMDTIDETLEKAGLSLAECDFFAAVVGAGSFTGIRIGVSVVKGFALACQKPTLPITSFDALAYNRLSEKSLCLINALHGYYYVCGYDKGEIVFPPAYLSEEETLALAKADGYELLSYEKLPISCVTVDPVQGLQSAVEASAVKQKFAPLHALYVRKSSAEENLQK